MKKALVLLSAAALVFLAGPFVEAGDKPAPPQVVLKTSMGDITVELNREKAPKTVANFLNYVRSGYYDGTVFHRVISRFMIQGGGFASGMKKKTAGKSIQNEADNGLKNERGTIAMARTREPHSASAQFFINTVDNTFLNHKSKDARGWGYAVFGKVVDGMAVVDAIEKVKTGNQGMFKNVPAEPVVIEKAYVK